jgi:tetratricopeptide (TPR) repeat protein
MQEEAIKMLEESAAKFPENPEYPYELAFLRELRVTQLCKSRQFDEAIPLLRRLGDAPPDRTDFRAELVFETAKSNRLEETMATLEKVADVFDHLPDYRPELAKILSINGEPAAAVSIYRRLVEDYPDVAEHKAQLARRLSASGDVDAAFAILQKLVQEYPDVTEYRKNLGLAYFNRGHGPFHKRDYETALPAFDQAIRFDPDHAEAYDHRGAIHLARRDWDKAIADYTEAIRLGPLYDAAYTQRAGAYVLKGEYVKALADLAEAVRREPDNANTRYSHALVVLSSDDLADYREVCSETLRHFSKTEDTGAGHWVAWACVLGPDAVDDFSAPIALAEKAVESEPKRVSYMNTLGAILFRAGRLEEAIQRLAEANKLLEDPDSSAMSSPAYTWYFLAMAHQANKQAEVAKKWLDKATEWTDKVVREDEEGTNPLSWNRRLTLKLLREEAETMIEKNEGGR